MPTLNTFFGIVSAIIQLACFIPYIRLILAKTVKPHSFTWGLWGLLSAIACVAQLRSGGGFGAMMAIVNMVMCGWICAYALRVYSTTYVTRSDWILLIGALSAIPVWLLTETPLWSVVIICAINFAAFLPTVRKAWHAPDTESAAVFFWGAVASFFAIIGMQTASFVTILYPSWIMIANLGFVIMLIARRKALAVSYSP